MTSKEREREYQVPDRYILYTDSEQTVACVLRRGPEFGPRHPPPILYAVLLTLVSREPGRKGFPRLWMAAGAS